MPANMKKVMEIMGVHRLSCVAHSMLLVVNEGLLSQHSASDAVAVGKSIVGHFKQSPLAYSQLPDIHLEMNVEPKCFKQDIRTRWNNTYIMI